MKRDFVENDLYALGCIFWCSIDLILFLDFQHQFLRGYREAFIDSAETFTRNPVLELIAKIRLC